MSTETDKLPPWHAAARLFPEHSPEEIGMMAVAFASGELGQIEPVVWWQKNEGGKIYRLDGRGRYAAAFTAKVAAADVPYRLITGGDPYLISMGLNASRRMLTKAQLKDAATAYLKACEGKQSDLAIARACRLSDKTVAKLRAACSEIPNAATRIDSTGREQPATRPPKPKTAGNAGMATKAAQVVAQYVANRELFDPFFKQAFDDLAVVMGEHITRQEDRPAAADSRPAVVLVTALLQQALTALGEVSREDMATEEGKALREARKALDKAMARYGAD